MLCPGPHSEETLGVDGRRLSVPCVNLKSRMEGCSKLKIGRKEAHYIGDQWPHLEVKRSKGSRSLRHLSPWLKISHIFGTGKPTNFKLGIRMETYAMTSNGKGQGHNVTSSVWCMFAHNSTTKSRTGTKICRKVDCATCDVAHEFQGQRVKGQGYRMDKCHDEAISSDNEGLRVQTWNTDAARKPALAARWPSTWKLRVGWLFKSPLAGGGDILCRPHYRPYSWF